MNKNKLIKEAKNCKTQEELIELASKNNINLNNEEANSIYSTLSKTGELSDNELENTNGGSPCGDLYNSESTPKYKVDDIVKWNEIRAVILNVHEKVSYGDNWTDYYGEAYCYDIRIIQDLGRVKYGTTMANIYEPYLSY